MTKASTLTLVTFITLNSIAIGQERLLDTYQCPSALAAGTCSKNCERIGDSKKSFRVNKEEKAIQEIDYVGKNIQISSRVWKNCIIFDEKNWDCSKEEGDKKTYDVRHFVKMTNGFYSNVYYRFDPESKDRTVAAECAK